MGEEEGGGAGEGGISISRTKLLDKYGVGGSVRVRSIGVP